MEMWEATEFSLRGKLRFTEPRGFDIGFLIREKNKVNCESDCSQLKLIKSRTLLSISCFFHQPLNEMLFLGLQ